MSLWHTTQRNKSPVVLPVTPLLDTATRFENMHAHTSGSHSILLLSPSSLSEGNPPNKGKGKVDGGFGREEQEQKKREMTREKTVGGREETKTTTEDQKQMQQAGLDSRETRQGVAQYVGDNVSDLEVYYDHQRMPFHEQQHHHQHHQSDKLLPDVHLHTAGGIVDAGHDEGAVGLSLLTHAVCEEDGAGEVDEEEEDECCDSDVERERERVREERLSQLLRNTSGQQVCVCGCGCGCGWVCVCVSERLCNVFKCVYSCTRDAFICLVAVS